MHEVQDTMWLEMGSEAGRREPLSQGHTQLWRSPCPRPLYALVFTGTKKWTIIWQIQDPTLQRKDVCIQQRIQSRAFGSKTATLSPNPSKEEDVHS